MLFQTPELNAQELAVIGEIDGLSEKLRLRLYTPRRWMGSLRRVQFARAVQGSNSIEGYHASLDDAAAIDLGQEPLDASEETRLAIKGYADAMTYVLQLHQEPNFHFGEQLLRSLHFIMMSHDLKNRPGLWRSGSIYVRNDATGETVYEGPDVEEVGGLMHQLALQLENDSASHPMVLAAMAHLNLVMIHPFRDGNGRMGRCAQTLVLARNGILSPVFCSIEEYLGANTQAYYDVLAEVGAGSWQPERDARPWIRFILTAHMRQARTTLRRVKEAESLWDELEKLIAERGVNPRTIFALYDACVGFRVRNATYRAIALAEDETSGLTEQAASRDLKNLHESGLLVPHGEKRGRFYTASPELRLLRSRIIDARDPRDDSDPFAA